MARPATGNTNTSSGGAIDELVAALKLSLKESRDAPIPVGPTDRVKLTVDAIRGGATAVEAMTAAGYGTKFIAGRAAGWAEWLEDAGLLKVGQAVRVAVGTLPDVTPVRAPDGGADDEEN